MLVLLETPAGYALFKVSDEGKITSESDVLSHFSSTKSAQNLIKLKAFSKFKDTEEAVQAVVSSQELGSLTKNLKSFLKKECGDSEKLAVIEGKLGGLINKQLGINCVHNEAIAELFRGIQSHLEVLIDELNMETLKAMRVGLAHSLARQTLKFSPDKVDLMIVQAISLFDDLDKELNIYGMRVREWYGWHFPELTKIITDNLLYSRTVLKLGARTNAASLEFGDILPEEMEREVKQMAIVSMGTEISDSDMANVKLLAHQVATISEYRLQLLSYLKNRMEAIAPNLSMMVGELVGARLIARAGSLMNLAKQPSSTVQILGAEKALFRALKAKKQTPKYGLIYHAALVNQASGKSKAKISRMLAAKTALSVRVDALGESSTATVAIQDLASVEQRLRRLEGGESTKLSGKGRSNQKFEKFKPKQTPAYNPASDTVMTDVTKKTKENENSKKKRTADEVDEEDAAPVKKLKTDENGSVGKKEKKGKKEEKEEKKEKKDKKEKKEEKEEKEEKSEKKEKKEKKDKKEKKEEKEEKSEKKEKKEKKDKK